MLYKTTTRRSESQEQVKHRDVADNSICSTLVVVWNRQILTASQQPLIRMTFRAKPKCGCYHELSLVGELCFFRYLYLTGCAPNPFGSHFYASPVPGSDQ
jgi:hypothetical protein